MIRHRWFPPRCSSHTGRAPPAPSRFSRAGAEQSQQSRGAERLCSCSERAHIDSQGFVRPKGSNFHSRDGSVESGQPWVPVLSPGGVRGVLCPCAGRDFISLSSQIWAMGLRAEISSVGLNRGVVRASLPPPARLRQLLQAQVIPVSRGTSLQQMELLAAKEVSTQCQQENLHRRCPRRAGWTKPAQEAAQSP